MAACCHIDSSSEIILDMPSIERNYVLVKTYLIGGPTERVLPPRELTVVSRWACILAHFAALVLTKAAKSDLDLDSQSVTKYDLVLTTQREQYMYNTVLGQWDCCTASVHVHCTHRRIEGQMKCTRTRCSPHTLFPPVMSAHSQANPQVNKVLCITLS